VFILGFYTICQSLSQLICYTQCIVVRLYGSYSSLRGVKIEFQIHLFGVHVVYQTRVACSHACFPRTPGKRWCDSYYCIQNLVWV